MTSVELSPLSVSRDPSKNNIRGSAANNLGGNNFNNVVLSGLDGSVNVDRNINDVEELLENEEWVLQPDDVTIVKSIVLGRGGFGIVYAGNVYLFGCNVVKYISILFGV
jgi:hypothetical protein